MMYRVIDMKGLVLTLRNNQHKLSLLPEFRKHGSDIKLAVSRYGIRLVFAALFLLGLVVGAACSESFSQETFEKLDLLFLTDIDARMQMSIFELFVSCFVSYFLFLFCAFLCGLSAWGFSAIPFLSAFKGFATGLSSAFIFSLYRAGGVGFYILVILPGTVLFLFVLIRFSVCAWHLSLRYARLSMFGCEREPEIGVHIKRYLKSAFFAVLCSAGCAAADMMLWILFAEKFNL